MNGTITMSQRELSRLEVMQKLSERRLKQSTAAERLHLSTRQIKRLYKAYQAFGAAGLVSKKRNKPSNRQLSPSLSQQIINLITEHYRDFGPTLAAEKLTEIHGIKVSIEKVRKLMMEAHLWIPRSQHLKRSYQPRYRRPAFGELIQIDGSNHDWFEGRAPKCTLLVYIDDATSQLMGLRFVPHESTFTYFQITREYLLQHGKPRAFYSDKLGVFRVNQSSAQLKGDGITQFGRALKELNIEIIFANSCQAKGRVERANKTLQDRLVKELRLKGIDTIEEANFFLPEFIEDFNRRFRKPPLSDYNAHRPLLAHEHLENILCWKEERTLTNNLTIQYDKRLYLIEDTEENRKLRRKRITVFDQEGGGLELYDGDRKLNFKLFYDRLSRVIDAGSIVSNKRLDSILDFIKEEQDKRSFLRSQSTPSRSHQGLSHAKVLKRQEESIRP